MRWITWMESIVKEHFIELAFFSLFCFFQKLILWKVLFIYFPLFTKQKSKKWIFSAQFMYNMNTAAAVVCANASNLKYSSMSRWKKLNSSIFCIILKLFIIVNWIVWIRIHVVRWVFKMMRIWKNEIEEKNKIDWKILNECEYIQIRKYQLL